MLTIGLAYVHVHVGKGRQQRVHDIVDQCCSCSSQIDADAACGVCALESASFVCFWDCAWCPD